MTVKSMAIRAAVMMDKSMAKEMEYIMMGLFDDRLHGVLRGRVGEWVADWIVTSVEH